jgi:dsDNA-specific endonuclease/ATPase MutS2
MARRNTRSRQDIEEYDLHGLTPYEAELRITRLIQEHAGKAGYSFRLIHGQGNGVLSEMVTRIGKGDQRVQSVERSFFNPGVTTITLNGKRDPPRTSLVQTPPDWELPPPPIRQRKR